MPLNLGSGSLFNTTIEERWKGVDADRMQSLESVGSDSDTTFNMTNEWSASAISATLEVKPDELVVVTASCVLESNTANETVQMKIRRDTTFISYTQWVKNVSGTMAAPASVCILDNPGEGPHTYEIWGVGSDGTGKMYSMHLCAFVLAVK